MLLGETGKCINILAKVDTIDAIHQYDEILEEVVETIKSSAHTGKIGDGKIFVSNIEEIIRIRTGEKNSDAI